MTEKIDLNKYFYYDETSESCLRWKVDILTGKQYLRKLVSKHDVAGSFKQKENRWVVCLKGTMLKVHRVILELAGEPLHKHYVVDHMDGDSSNNKFHNLRVVTNAVNTQNCRKSINNTSGFTGVRWNAMVRSGNTVYHYAMAHWTDLKGKSKSKNFPIKSLGLLPAWAAACAHREAIIEQLNLQGADYTERHGK